MQWNCAIDNGPQRIGLYLLYFIHFCKLNIKKEFILCYSLENFKTERARKKKISIIQGESHHITLEIDISKHFRAGARFSKEKL